MSSQCAYSAQYIYQAHQSKYPTGLNISDPWWGHIVTTQIVGNPFQDLASSPQMRYLPSTTLNYEPILFHEKKIPSGYSDTLCPTNKQISTTHLHTGLGPKIDVSVYKIFSSLQSRIDFCCLFLSSQQFSAVTADCNVPFGENRHLHFCPKIGGFTSGQ